MIELSEAITAHKAAWQAFQDAPEGANRKSLDAEEDLNAAFDMLIAVLARTTTSASVAHDLLTHLQWFIGEEGEQAPIEARAILAAIDLSLEAGNAEP